MKDIAALCVCVGAAGFIGGMSVQGNINKAQNKPRVMKTQAIDFPCDPLIITTPDLSQQIKGVPFEPGDPFINTVARVTNPQPVPEPPAWAIIGLIGVSAGLALYLRRKS